MKREINGRESGRRKQSRKNLERSASDAIRISGSDREFLGAIAVLLEEWSSTEDDEACGHL